MRGVLIYCADYHCSHSIALSADRCLKGPRYIAVIATNAMTITMMTRMMRLGMEPILVRLQGISMN